jgi:hypothetical protein
MKRFFMKWSLVITVALSGTIPATISFAAGVAFNDLSGHWSRAAVELAVSKGYVDGYEDGTFRPDGTLTRAEFTKLVVTALKVPVDAAGTVSGGAWYQPYVSAATKQGFYKTEDFTGWDQPMTRLEMSRMASRSAGLQAENENQWMYQATKAGLIQGVDDTGSLEVEGTTTRAQSVTIIERILQVKAGQSLQADKHAVNRAELLWHQTNIFTVMPEFFSKVSSTDYWSTDKLTLTTLDGLWKGTVEQLVAINVNDLQDPGWELLPPRDELRWTGQNVKESYSIKEYSGYILVMVSHVDHNNDTSIYAKTNRVEFSTAGTKQGDGMQLLKGKLIEPIGVFHKKLNDLNAIIVPKQLHTNNYFGIKISAPKIGSGGTERVLIDSWAPSIINP